jgi:hypothetical protein
MSRPLVLSVQSIQSKLALIALYRFSFDVQTFASKFKDDVCQTGGLV